MCGNHVVEHSNNRTVLGSTQKLGKAANHLIDSSENAFVGWAFNSELCMLLKGAVNFILKENFQLQSYLMDFELFFCFCFFFS